ncbi:MAG: ArgP/LysG family DNA-binding transcriptional regulator [Hyphomicrobiales bacterium]|nr:MAG: ArgP/LysG family DNA-binding transcriptional regulator [Hyphomicrobiales bacterium]
MLNYELLMGLKAVISEGSFEAAAKSLNITPSAVSQRVKLLEDRLEALLIIRGKPCTATEYGYALFKHTEQIEVLEKNLFDTLPKNTALNAAGALNLRMAVNEDSMATWFPAAMGEISRSGNFLFDIIIDDQEQTTNLLRRGDVVAAITARKNPTQGFQNSYIGSLRYVAIASPKFVVDNFANGIVSPKSISAAPCITFNRKDELPTKWIKQVCNKNVNCMINWIPSLEGYIKSCVEGIGWGIHPLILVEEYIENGTLVELVPESYIDIPLYWQYSSSYGKIMTDISEMIVATGKKLLHQ